jgi:hypothetical protein
MEDSLAEHGFRIVPRVLSEPQQAELLETLAIPVRAGRRGLLVNPQIRGLAESLALKDLVRPHMSTEPVAVRALYFDKSLETNWLVPWHQDLTIAVTLQAEVEGFGPWSFKEGVPHVQPPVEYLEQMLAVRLHFDETDVSNGALKVLAGTHRHGKFSGEQIAMFRDQCPVTLCTAQPGDALLMRPLLLHASSRSTSACHRRVLHIEYAGFTLPAGLDWSEAA